MMRLCAKARVFMLTALSCAATFAPAQQTNSHVGLPIDWSFRHVIHHSKVDSTFYQLSDKEPRVIYNWLQHAHANVPSAATTAVTAPPVGDPDVPFGPRPRAETIVRPPIRRDWNFTLGAGSIAPNMAAAKYTFDVTATPSCSKDFLIAGLNVAGSATQPNLVGFTNLYSGTTGSTFNVASASEAGTTVTVTTTAANTFVTGQSVTVSGITPSGYNGTFQVTVVNSTTFTYTDASGLGAAVVTGATVIQSGICGTAPTVTWAYNASTGGGSILTSPSLSIDGTGVAFIESTASSTIFHVLTLGTTGSNGSFSSATNQYVAVQPDNTGVLNNATLKSVTATSTASDTRSSAYVDYGNDVAYFGDDDGKLYKTTCVFQCSISGLTLGIATGWPVTVAPAGTRMAAPVVDTGTNNVILGGSNGLLYLVPLASCPGAGCAAAIKSATVGTNNANGAILEGVLLDSTFQTMFTTAGDNGAGVGTFVQLNESMTALASITTHASAYLIPNGALDDEYYNNSLGGTTVTGNAYFCGTVTGQAQAGLFTVGFTANAGALSTANPPKMASSSGTNLPGNTGVTCSPLTTFTSGSVERLFITQSSVPSTKCTGASATDGCVFDYTINPSTGTATLSVGASEHGGTSAVIVDNSSSSSQAASLYFGTLSTAAGSASAPNCTYTVANTPAFCLVKLTQNGLK